MVLKGYAAPEVERAYTHARELCEKLGETPDLFPALYGLFAVHLLRGELREAYELVEQLLRLAQSADDRALLLLAHHGLGHTSYWMGELLPSREHLEIAITLLDAERHRPLIFSYLGLDERVGSLLHTGWTLWLLGFPDQALKRGNEALALAQALSHPYSLGFAELSIVVLRAYRREPRAAQEGAESVIALSAEHGFSQLLAVATALLGGAKAEQGRHEEAIAQLREGLAAYRAIGAEVGRPYFLCLLAESCKETGHFDEGLNALTEALAAAEEHENRVFEAEAHRLKGGLLLRRDDSNAAEAQSCYERAIKAARKQSAKSLELRAAMSLAQLLVKQGKRDEARTMLAEIYGWFTEGFDTADLKDAKALLEELGAQQDALHKM
jgi:predicted ATPase